ncbi:MAG TPA: lipocalin-like domain-containing protein [Lacunisphaera sp.]|nr:lipocalin-like domain-containing protein [Lacunisphaera sp.]
MKPLSMTLPGTWKLVSRTDRTRSGERRTEPSLGDDPVALLFYDRAGNFAAQFMKRDRSGPLGEGPRGGPNNSRAQGGYDAYFGTYTVDDATGAVTQRLTGALSKENVGMVVARKMVVAGDTLTIQLDTAAADGEAVIRTLVWSRAG